MASKTVAPPSSAAPNSKVSHDTIEKAIKALLKWKNSQSESQKPQLLPEDDFMYLILTLKKIPPKGIARTTPHKLPVPHSLLSSSSSELCLIIDDRPKSNLTSKDSKKKIKSENIPVSKVIKLSKLKTDYKSFEAKRKLCDSYDLFFADKRVINLLPKLLGKQFFRQKKLPLPVNLAHKNWKEQIERGCSSALLYVKTGTCSVVRVGRVSMEIGEVVENVVAVINKAVEGVVPKGWAGVRSLNLKFSDSLALPIYQTVPDMKLKIQGIKDSVEGGGELEVKGEKKKDENSGKKKGSKKGRIHEVRYMDASVDDDEDENDNAGGKSENDDLGSVKIPGKKTKNGKVVSVLNGEKMGKKVGKVEKGVSDDAKDDDESKKSENEDLGSAKIVGKKRKKGDSKKGPILNELSGEKVGKKTGNVKERGSDNGKGDNESNKSENEDLGSAKSMGKKKRKGDSIPSELDGEKIPKKIGKMEKGGNDSGKDDKESNKSENKDLGSAKLMGKKKRKGDSIPSELNGEKIAKKIGMVEKGRSDSGKDDKESNKSENDDLGSVGLRGKKKKGDLIKGKDEEKKAKKMSKKGDGEEQKKVGFVLTGVEESGGKKGKKKSDLGAKLENTVADVKIKKSKKKLAE